MPSPPVEDIASEASSFTFDFPYTPSTISAEADRKTPSPDSRLYSLREILQTTPPGWFPSSSQETRPRAPTERPRPLSTFSIPESALTNNSALTVDSTSAADKMKFLISKKSFKSMSKKGKDKADDGSEAAAASSSMMTAPTGAGTALAPIVNPREVSAAGPSASGSSTQADNDLENLSAYQAFEKMVKDREAGHDPDYGIPEPDVPELCFPGFGVLPNITQEVQTWYRSIRVLLSYGFDEMNFAGGKYRDVIHATYPLRDALNKIMWDKCITRIEGAALVRFGRIYARAQGDAADGLMINQNYLHRCGLEGLQPCLAQIFKADVTRRAHSTPPSAEVLQAINSTITRLEHQVAKGPNAEA